MAGNIYHSWNGTVLTITSDSGTSSANLKGDDGARGAQGVAGGTLYSVSQAATNLLDNTYFLNPINQRGFTSGDTVGAWKYCIDRWANYTAKDGTITFKENGISFNFSLTQHLNNEVIKAGMKVTAAVKWSDGLIQTAAGTITKGSSWTWFFSGYNDGRGIGVVDNGNGSNSVRIDNDNGYTLEWAALYEGEYTVDTLPAYQPKPYSAELLECQRYYIKIATQPINGWCYNWGRVSAFVSLPVKMRVPYPTVVLAQETPNFYVNATAYNAALEGSTSVENGVVIYYTHTAAINGQCVIPEFAAEINADL